LSDNEFKDLQNFGKVIEKKPENNTKVIVKEKKNFYKQLKPVFSYIKKKTLILATKLLKYTIIASKGIYKKIKSTKLPKLRTQNYAYKIVETKKQRRNKTIIVRKRVPYKYDHLGLNPKKSNLGTLFYLSFKEDSNQETKSEAYTRLKDSVWDFPIKNKKRKIK